MKKRKKLGYERLETRRVLAANLGCEMLQIVDAQPEVEECIVAPDIVEDAASDIALDLDGTDIDAEVPETEPAENAEVVEAQLDLEDGMDGFFGTLDAENGSDTLSFTPPTDGLVEVVVASSFGEASTQLEIRDDAGNLITASTTEGLDGFQTISFAGNADQIYELKISTDAGVSGSFQVTVGVEPGASAEANFDNDTPTDIDSGVEGVAETEDETEDGTEAIGDQDLELDADTDPTTDGLVEQEQTTDEETSANDSAEQDQNGDQDQVTDQDSSNPNEIVDEVVADEIEEVLVDDVDSTLLDETVEPGLEDDSPEGSATDELADELVNGIVSEVTDEISDDLETIDNIVDSVVDTIVDEFEEAGHDIGDIDVDITPANPANEDETGDSVTTILDEGTDDDTTELVDVDLVDPSNETNSSDAGTPETETGAVDETIGDENEATITADAEADVDVSAEDQTVIDDVTATDEPTLVDNAESGEATDLDAEDEQRADQHADEIGEDATELNFVDGSAELIGELETVDDTDVFKITAEADGRVTLNIGEPTGENNLDIVVVDSNGDSVVDGATNEAVRIGFEASAGAEYFVTIGSDVDQLGTYSILAEAPVASANTTDLAIGEDNDSHDGECLNEIAVTPNAPVQASANADDQNSAEATDSEQEALDDFFAESNFEWDFSFDGDRFYSRLSNG